MTFPILTVPLTLSLPSSTDDDEQSYHISEYFAAHPRHVLGEWSEREGSRGRLDLSVRWPFVGSVVNGVSSLLSDAAKEIASDVKVKAVTAAPLDQSSRAYSPDGSAGDSTVGDAARNVAVQSQSSHPDQSATDDNQPSPEQLARDLYALAKNALTCSQNSADRLPLLRQAQTAYAAFKGKWGSLRACLGKGGTLSSTKLARSREAAFLAALETSRGEPSRLLSYHQLPTDNASTDRQLTISDALLVCLDERGHASADRVSQLLSIAPDEAHQQLLAARLAFLSPPGCPSRANLPVDIDLVSSHEYITGDVGGKLVIAKAAAESDPRYSPNVEALTIALPDPLGPEDITVGLGAQWVPVEIYKDWLMSLFPGHKWGLSVERLESSAGWAINCTNPKLSADDSTLRTSRFSGMELLRDAINAKMPVAWDEWKDAEGKTHRVRNEPATMEAQARVAELRSRFDAWVWLGASGGQVDSSDEAASAAAKRCKLLCSLYNDKFNGHVPRDFSGDHLTFRGLAATVGHGRSEVAYTPKSRQLRGVAKVLAGGTRDRSAYLVYPPGFGKTDPAILSAVKLTQLGMARRTLIAVPKPVVVQWHARFLTLFPGLADEVLCCDDPVYGIAGYKEVKSARSSSKNPVVSSRSDAGGKVQAEDGKNQRGYSPREAFLASMAAPGWRYLIISHEMLREIPLSQSAFQSLLDEELGELRECLRDTEEVGSKAGSKGARRSLREREAQLQDMQVKHEAKWAELRDRDRAPVSWEDLGVDYLIGDECFTGSTLIATQQGMLRIDEIEARLPLDAYSVAADRSIRLRKIIRVWKRGVKKQIIKLSFGKNSVYATVDHKFYTPAGQQKAGTLHEGDLVYGASEIVSVLQHTFRYTQQKSQILQPDLRRQRNYIWNTEKLYSKELSDMQQGFHWCGTLAVTAILREKLLGKMANVPTRYERTHCCSAQREAFALERDKAPRCFRKDATEQPDERSCSSGKNGCQLTGTNFSSEGWQWSTYQTSNYACRSVKSSDGSANQYCSGAWSIPEFTDVLQGRLGPCWGEVGNRSGWQYAQAKEVEILRQAQGSSPECFRVDSVEILEPGSAEYVTACGGQNYVYDLEIADDHNYFANGILVSNCNAWKNLGISTKQESVAGMPRSESQRAYDAYCKIQSVFRAGGRVTCLSGTPLTNTIAETFIWMKMIQPNLLKHLGLSHFDAWASVFCEPFSSVELTATGTYKTVTRLRYKNLPELV